MKSFIIIILLILPYLGISQVIDSNSYKVGTEGEQEYRWGENIFRENSGRQSFETFKGKVSVINKNTIKYDNNVIQIFDSESYVINIFEKGLLYPSLILKNEDSKTQIEFDSISRVKLVNIDSSIFYNLVRIDSLSISNVEELKYSGQSPKIKRFSFLLWQKNFMNPTLYFFELTNDSATEGTNIKIFINGARLTVFKYGSILI